VNFFGFLQGAAIVGDGLKIQEPLAKRKLISSILEGWLQISPNPPRIHGKQPSNSTLKIAENLQLV